MICHSFVKFVTVDLNPNKVFKHTCWIILPGKRCKNYTVCEKSFVHWSYLNIHTCWRILVIGHSYVQFVTNILNLKKMFKDIWGFTFLLELGVPVVCKASVCQALMGARRRQAREQGSENITMRWGYKGLRSREDTLDTIVSLAILAGAGGLKWKWAHIVPTKGSRLACA